MQVAAYFKWIFVTVGINTVAGSNCSSSQYECVNGKCISLDALCDYHNDCGDNSDEIRNVAGFKCQMGYKRHICVLPQKYVVDEMIYCADESDGCFVNGTMSNNKCHKCLKTGEILAANQLCNGVIDCLDASDECLCETTEAEPLCSHVQPGGMILCDNDSTIIKLNEVCDGKLDCLDHTDERFCRRPQGKEVVECASSSGQESSIILALTCNGIPECYDYSDECASNCTDAGAFCGLSEVIMENGGLVCPDRALTSRNLTIKPSDICDGLWTNCYYPILTEEVLCPARLYCDPSEKSFNSISKTRACDGIKDCNDSFDENICRERFNCASGVPLSVPLTYVLDGVDDCADGSDECPLSLNDSLYTSRYQLNISVGLIVWLFIMAIIGLLGNILGFSYSLRDLIRLGINASLSWSNYVLVMILNLTVANGMMAIYLFFISIKAVELLGVTCLYSLSWRTSIGCNFIGSLSIVSSIASLFIIAIIMTVWLYSVYYPTQAQTIPWYWALLAIALTWCSAVFIALIPSMDPNTFIERYWIQSKYFNTDLVKLSFFEDFFQRLIYITQPANSTALSPGFDFNQFLISNYPQFQILGYYGFYSENSLCFPHFYIPSGSQGWIYPIIIVTIISILIVWSVLSYLLIYKHYLTPIRVNNSPSKAGKMQRRVIKLLAVNFLVWFCICFATYMQLTVATEFPNVIYVVTALFLFPICSVLNPILYFEPFRFVALKLGCCKSNDDNLHVNQRQSAHQPPEAIALRSNH